MTKTRKPRKSKLRKSRAEALLERARKNPSPHVSHSDQMELLDYIKQKAFEDLDRAIVAELEKGGRK